jgi:hypothetical protein
MGSQPRPAGPRLAVQEKNRYNQNGFWRKSMSKEIKKKSTPRESPEQRAARWQRLVFIILSLMIILAMVLSVVSTL